MLALSPWLIDPVSNEPSSAVAVCGTESLFVHVTVSPTETWSSGTENANPSIVTSLLEASGEAAGEPGASSVAGSSVATGASTAGEDSASVPVSAAGVPSAAGGTKR